MTISKVRPILAHLLVWLVIVAPPVSLLRGEALAEEIGSNPLHAIGFDPQLPAELSSVGRHLAAGGSTGALALLGSSGALHSGEAVLPDENPWAVRKWIPLLLLLGVSAGITFGIDSPDSPRWTDNNGFDDSARDSLRISSKDGRKAANTASTALLAVNAGLLVGDWVLERETYSPLDSFRIDTSWIFGGQLTTVGTKLAAARERPYVQDCRSGAVSSGCGSDGRFESFYSGHASLSSTFAGLLCARRLHRPERGAADYLLCGGASSLALATGFLRISSDKHWMSDVLVGWGTGIVFGYVLPSIFHYGKPESRRSSRPTATHFVTPIAGTSVWGLRYDVKY